MGVEGWGDLLSIQPQFLCNQPIAGCVSITPTTNFIALRPRESEPDRSVEETPLQAADGRDWLIEKE